MPDRYWIVFPNGDRRLIEPIAAEVERIAEQARRSGAELVVESGRGVVRPPAPAFEPPPSAMGPLFRLRLSRIYVCRAPFRIDVLTRPTVRILGNYWHRRALIRIYAVDGVLGPRSFEELFETFLHELAHHLEYTEPDSFGVESCMRVRGRMHSRLFWRILGELKSRWVESARLQ